MKKLSFLILFLVLGISTSAQELNPNYFHDLSGFEDSTGTTQLFYRLYKPNSYTCSYEGYTSQVNTYNNHLRHFNISADTDSLFLRDFAGQSVDCTEIPYQMMNFIIVDEDLSNPYSIYQSISGLTGGTWFGDLFDPKFNLGIANPMTLNFDYSTNSFIISTPLNEFIIKRNSDNNYDPNFKKTYKFPLAQDSLWNGKSYDDGFNDSLLIDFTVLGINPYSTNQYVGFKDDSLVISYDKGSSYKKVIVEDLSEFNIEGIKFDKTVFDADTSTFYIKSKRTWATNSAPKIFRVMSIDDSWSFKKLLPDSESRRISVDPSSSGDLYLSDSTKVFFSQDYGETMDEILEFEEEVTGLYKKSNLDILYVLTRTDLYKVENGQPTSIKKVPVSSEPEAEIPEQITLHQNYPNPFNPSTTIRFDLKESAFTKLTVYDLLGRKVRELVNEVRPAGTNTIQFNASDLASGIYLYRLEAESIIQTKRLTLIK